MTMVLASDVNEQNLSVADEIRNPETPLLRKLELSSHLNIFTEKEFVIIMQKMIIF